MIYDSGIMCGDKELANALWRRFLLAGDHPDPEKIEILVSYVRRTMSALDHVEINALVIHGKFSWLALKESQ